MSYPSELPPHLQPVVRTGKPVLRLDFCDFHPGYRKTNNFFYHLLQQRFEVEICDRPEFLIYSHEGDQHKLYRCTKIYYSVESFRPDFSECDYALSFFDLNDPRNLRVPLYVFYGGPGLISKEGVDVAQLLASKTGFCSFVAGNRNLKKTRRRIEFFHRLSRYKKVDSAGPVLNNVGYGLPLGGAHKVNFLRRYKFNLAFENKSLLSYTTEKIYEAMQARTVPIYWGNPEIAREFNPRSFLNAHDFSSDDALIERIIELDQDDAKYLEYLRQPYCTDNVPNLYFSHDRILDFFERIVSTPIEPVARCRRYFQLGRWILCRRHRLCKAAVQ